MGNPNAAAPSDQVPPVTHFSHPHPLYLTDSQTLAQNSQCSACKLDASATVYTCKPCNFILHQNCYQLPQQIKHPFDQTHALVLQPKPVYAEGVFRCDACGNQGSGFSYTCGPCGVDLHTTCAFLAAEFTHQCHHHPLSLTFSAPYPGNSFSCDICKRVTSKTWMYRCNGCEFDAHLTCVAKVIPPPPMIQQQTRVMQVAPPIITARSIILAPQNPPNMGGYSGAPMSHHQNVAIGQPHNQFVGTPYPAAGMSAYGNLNQPGYAAPGTVKGGGMRGPLAVAAVEGITGGIAQAATGALLHGVFGIGGGGGGGGGGGLLDVMMGGGGGNGGADYGSGDYGGGDGSV